MPPTYRFTGIPESTKSRQDCFRVKMITTIWSLKKITSRRGFRNDRFFVLSIQITQIVPFAKPRETHIFSPSCPSTVQKEKLGNNVPCRIHKCVKCVCVALRRCPAPVQPPDEKIRSFWSKFQVLSSNLGHGTLHHSWAVDSGAPSLPVSRSCDNYNSSRDLRLLKKMCGC